MIIGVSGKINTGKDTVGKIIQYLTYCKDNGRISYDSYCILHYNRSNWKIVKFADKVKDIVCLLIGCTREQLEDEEFKNKELDEEWIRYGYADGFTRDEDGIPIMNVKYCDKEMYLLQYETNWQTAYKYPLTPRKLLTLIGTDIVRFIHPNTWINATMRDYIDDITDTDYDIEYKYDCITNDGNFSKFKPNWIITDVRFLNELKAIEDRGGFVIRVNRINFTSQDGHTYINKQDRTHPSETSLDSHLFKYNIDNNTTIKDLIKKVKDVLISEKII